jgi:peptidyl-prolyl cis-trans isomerase SurA
MLMDEYRDGILLFDLTDKKVWSKAVKDTVGLKDFYGKNKTHFMWEERADATVYSCASREVADQVKKMLKKSGVSDADILTEVNKKSQLNLSVEPRLFQKGENDLIDKAWVPGMTAEKNENGKIIFANVRKLVPPSPKALSDAKGLVTAEYQAQLEKDWLESLKKKYKVEVNQKVFEGIK